MILAFILPVHNRHLETDDRNVVNGIALSGLAFRYGFYSTILLKKEFDNLKKRHDHIPKQSQSNWTIWGIFSSSRMEPMCWVKKFRGKFSNWDLKIRQFNETGPYYSCCRISGRLVLNWIHTTSVSSVYECCYCVSLWIYFPSFFREEFSPGGRECSLYLSLFSSLHNY